MDKTIRLGYKSLLTRILLGVGGVFFLVVLNGGFVFLAKYQVSVYFLFLGGICVIGLGLVFWWLIGVKYIFESNKIVVKLPWGKKHKFLAKDIVNIRKKNSVGLSKVGYKTNLSIKKMYLLTSSQNVYEIELQNGQKVYISPRSVSESVLQYYQK